MTIYQANLVLPLWLVTALFAAVSVLQSAAAEFALREIPAPVSRNVDFTVDVRPILERSCIECHADGKRKGGFSMDHIHSLLAGGESGAAVVSGKSADSLLIELVFSDDPDSRMPSKGEPLSGSEISILRAWIDQGLPWEKGFAFAKFKNAPMAPRKVALPPGPELNPVDRLLARYDEEQGIGSRTVVSDTVFARRVFLDTIGLLPTLPELDAFRASNDPEKRTRLVTDLLMDSRHYADHWVTFWNDCLRNSYTRQYHGDGNGEAITEWLKTSLWENKPYDQLVRELINPVPGSDGFIKGVIWRGTVNASQVSEMQAAQNMSQVFLGLNIKCASCHDSFINDWSLKQTYALASIFADEPLDIHRCNKPIGEKSTPAFLYPELGKIDPAAPKAERVKQLSEIMTTEKNGRLARTIVNRLWAIFFGRGLVEPVDEMDNSPWNQDLLDWLAVDLVDHGYDLKHTMSLLLTSQAYQRPSVALDADAEKFVFQGPVVRRMTAEQFLDGLDQIILAVGGGSIPPELPKSFDRETALFDSGIMTGGAKTIDVDISNAELLVLVARPGKNGTNSDHANWAEPFLYEAGGKMVHLSGLDWASATTGWGEVKKNRSVTDKPLRIANVTYRYGIGTHADSVIAFDISGKGFTRFTATAGVDRVGLDDPGSKADVEFIVYGVPKDTSASAARGIGRTRAGLRNLDRLMQSLGRPKRDVVVTQRESVATTAQLLELSNGKPLGEIMARGGEALVTGGRDAGAIVDLLFATALGRQPSGEEKITALALVGNPVNAGGAEDLFWVLAMHPEFQLIH